MIFAHPSYQNTLEQFIRKMSLLCFFFLFSYFLFLIALNILGLVDFFSNVTSALNKTFEFQGKSMSPREGKVDYFDQQRFKAISF